MLPVLMLALYPSLLGATPPIEATPPTLAPPARVEGPPAPHWRGVGLSIAAGVAGTVGLAFNISRIGFVQRACAAIGASNSELESAIESCIHDSRAYISFSALAPLANAAALGLAAGAGAVNGRYRSWNTVHGGGRGAITGAYLGAGAGLLGASVIAYAVAQIGLWRDIYGIRGCLTEAELSGECVRSRWSGWLGAITISQAGASVGAGLVLFGVAYRIHRGRQRRRVTLSLQPALALTHVGFRLTGRF